jgi:dipeptidyl-peptidase-3
VPLNGPRTDCYRQEQWTPQAKALYDLLILTYSTNQGVLADLHALKTSSGLSDEDWNDLLQYTTQVCVPASCLFQ